MGVGVAAGVAFGVGLEVRRSRIGAGVVDGLVGRQAGSVRARLRVLGVSGCVGKVWLFRGCAVALGGGGGALQRG